MARRTGYWLKVLKNIECIPKNYDKGFELRVFGRVVLQFDIGARKATLYDAAVSKHVAIFVMNLFLENVVDCRIDNYHAVGESDENYQVSHSLKILKIFIIMYKLAVWGLLRLGASLLGRVRSGGSSSRNAIIFYWVQQWLVDIRNLGIGCQWRL